MKRTLYITCFICCVFLFFNPGAACPESAREALTDERVLDLVKNAPTSMDFPGSSAVYLLMEEKDTVNADGTAVYVMHTIWKVLDRQAIPLGEVSIPFDSSESTLKIDIARTIRPDNTVVNVAQEDIREVSPYSSFPLYNNIKLKQFSMPAMEIGSVVEYKATLKVFRPKMPGFFYSYWSFPPGLPVELSVFEISVPEGVEARYKVGNFDAKPEIITERGRKIYRWTVRDIFIKGVFEQFLPPYDEVCPSITFVTAKTWDEVAGWFYGLCESQVKTDAELEELLRKIVKRKGGDPQKIRKELYYLVSQSVRYVAIPLKASSYQPHSAVDVYKNRYGDCKGKSALLIALYKSAGIDAYFALLKERSEGPLIRDFPTLDFNHCIVALPEKDGGYTFLDPSLELCRFGYIPTTMQDIDIFVVKKDGYEFVKAPLERENIGGTKMETEMRIGEDYVIDVDEKDTFFGEEEIVVRMNTKYSTRDAMWAFFEQVAQSLFTNARLKDIDFSDPDNLDERFRISLKYEIRDHIKEAGNLLIFDIPGSRMNIMVSSEERVHPLWLPSLSKSEAVSTIVIPGGCKINYLPADIKKDTPFGYYERSVSSSGNRIVIKYLLKTKVLEVAPDVYSGYKEFIEYITKTSKESIVLEKL